MCIYIERERSASDITQTPAKIISGYVAFLKTPLVF